MLKLAVGAVIGAVVLVIYLFFAGVAEDRRSYEEAQRRGEV